MANGDDLKIGGFKDLSLATSGMEGSDTGLAKQTLPNTDYNTSRTNPYNNQNQFLALTGHGNTINFSATNLVDYAFGDANNVGTNKLSDEATIKQQYLEKGSGEKFFTLG